MNTSLKLCKLPGLVAEVRSHDADGHRSAPPATVTFTTPNAPARVPRTNERRVVVRRNVAFAFTALSPECHEMCFLKLAASIIVDRTSVTKRRIQSDVNELNRHGLVFDEMTDELARCAPWLKRT